MFVLIWATLLFSARGASQWGQEHCNYGFCITLIDGELTAEAGLCVVIPCSFTPRVGFMVQNIVWYKCEGNSWACTNGDPIFHSDNNINVQSEFKGRVSLLESDVSQKNCSIIINDLKESDSGSYQLRVNGYFNYWNSDGFTFSTKPTVSVKGLQKKPRVKIPTLTEGQQATLICIAPGLCSGSVPEITWTWTAAGGTESHITGNITALKTKNLTAVTQRHISALTFNPSAEHHNTNVTCKTSFIGGTTTEETSTLNVNYTKEVKITGNTSVKEGETLNLTCSVESVPPSLIMWSKLGSNTNFHNNTGSDTLVIPNVTTEHSGQYVCTVDYMSNTLKKNIHFTVILLKVSLQLLLSSNTNLQNGTSTDLHTDTGSAALVIHNVMAEHSGQYACTAQHLDVNMIIYTDVTVTYVRKPQITGNTTIKEGDVLNLTCSVESFPPALVVWKRVNSNTNLHTGTYIDLHNDTGSATLVIPNVTAEHFGQYICTSKHLDKTVISYANVIMAWFSKIHNGSGCVLQSDVLTCVCISEGFPLPTIKWPLLKKHTEYSIITTVSNQTVNSTVSLAVKNHGNTTFECVSNNEYGEAREKLLIQSVSEKVEQPSVFRLHYLEIIIAFLTGVLLSAIACFLPQKCCRKKRKSSEHLDETLEMVTSEDDALIYDGPALQDNQSHCQEGVEDCVASEKEVSKLNSEGKEVEYASIDFSLLKRKGAREAAKRQESTKTEYAEIKKAIKEEIGDDGGEEGEMVEDKEEEEVMMELEMKHCEPEKMEREEEAVYSTVKDVIDEI